LAELDALVAGGQVLDARLDGDVVVIAPPPAPKREKRR
jgi:hypothetical protein